MNEKDKDGFYRLIRKVPQAIGLPKEMKDDKPKKLKWPKFDKGSWKNSALKFLRKAFIPSTTVDFHFTKTENLVVAFNTKKKSKVFRFSTMLDLERLKALAKDYEDARVLISAGDGEYLSISIKSYIKLCDVDRMYIKFKLDAAYDDDSTCRVYDSQHTFTNINELAWFIIHHRHCIAGVYDVQAECYGFADYSFNFKIMVIHNDHRVETFKGDMNDFMKKYKLKPF